MGSPIRTSPDHSLLATPRGFSQLATSFIAYLRQGIHTHALSSLTIKLTLDTSLETPGSYDPGRSSGPARRSTTRTSRIASAPLRILAARSELATCVAHQYSIFKDLPDLKNPGVNHPRVIHLCVLTSSRRPVSQAAATSNLVGLGRLELPTSPLSGVRSSHLSYRPAD